MCVCECVCVHYIHNYTLTQNIHENRKRLLVFEIKDF